MATYCVTSGTRAARVDARSPRAAACLGVLQLVGIPVHRQSVDAFAVVDRGGATWGYRVRVYHADFGLRVDAQLQEREVVRVH